MTTSTVRLQSTIPVVPVSGIDEAMAFYCDKLGFAVDFQQGDYAGVMRDDAHLHLDGVVNQGAGMVTSRIETEGVDDLYAELEPQGVARPRGAHPHDAVGCTPVQRARLLRQPDHVRPIMSDHPRRSERGASGPAAGQERGT